MIIKDIHNKLLKVDARKYIIGVLILMLLISIPIMNKTSNLDQADEWIEHYGVLGISFSLVLGAVFGIILYFIKMFFLFVVPVSLLNGLFKKMEDYMRTLVILGLYLIAYAGLVFIQGDQSIWNMPLLYWLNQIVAIVSYVYTYLLFDQRRDIRPIMAVLILMVGGKVMAYLQLFFLM